MFSIRNSLTAIAFAVAVAACGGGGGNSNIEPAGPVAVSPTGLMLLADGATLRAGTATATGFAQTGSASIPADGLAEIFGVVVHPNKQWVYVTSAQQYGGNARLNRFAIDWTTGALSLVDSLPLTGEAGPSCAQNDYCAPVSMAVTADGTRLIVSEGRDRVYDTFAIAADGALSFVAESAYDGYRYHGVGINAAGSYIYRGSLAYARSGDEITPVGDRSNSFAGNASVVLNVGGTETLYTTLSDEEVAVLSLADPENPTTVSSIDPHIDGASALFMDVTKDGKRMVVVGTNSVAIVDFDGAALTVQDSITIASTSGYVRARGAAFNADGSLAAVSFQTGGAKLYAVAANGTLTEVANMPSSYTTRAVTFTTKP